MFHFAFNLKYIYNIVISQQICIGDLHPMTQSIPVLRGLGSSLSLTDTNKSETSLHKMGIRSHIKIQTYWGLLNWWEKQEVCLQHSFIQTSIRINDFSHSRSFLQKTRNNCTDAQWGTPTSETCPLYENEREGFTFWLR